MQYANLPWHFETQREYSLARISQKCQLDVFVPITWDAVPTTVYQPTDIKSSVEYKYHSSREALLRRDLEHKQIDAQLNREELRWKPYEHSPILNMSWQVFFASRYYFASY